MIIKLQNGVAELNYEKFGRKYSKMISINTLVDIFNSEKGISTPLLPFGTRKFVRKNDEITLYIEIPATTRRILYKNGSGKVIFDGVIPMPWGIMKIALKETKDNKYSLLGSYIYALKRPLISEEDKIYHYPAPNIFKEDSVCWGNLLDSIIFDSIDQTSMLIDTFFGSDYNTDLHPRINIYDRYEDLLRDLKNKTRFNYDCLVETGMTFADI